MSERKTLQESLEELERTWGEFKAVVLAEVSKSIWWLFAFVLLDIAAIVFIVVAWPTWALGL